MKIFQINGAVFGSTGKIMFGIAEAAEAQGHTVLCAAPITKTNRYANPSREYIKIGTYYGRCASVLLSRLTGLDGCFAVFATARLLQQMKRFSPDVVHLHNIHGSYLNLPMLFRYLKKSGVRVVWTLHDCWAFTGHCPHYDMVGCQKWKTACFDCPQFREYPKSYVDNAKWMHRLKKRWFLGFKDLTIITPSHWLAGEVRQSFLGVYPVHVIQNGINLDVFKPTPSDFRSKYHCEGKCILLGVAFGWSKRKGLDVFIELAKRLDERFRIVLVGTDANVERQLPDNVISIRQTQNQRELAEIYTAADVFVNPTREDTYPTVNMEAIACGTPVLTFRAGGSPEIPDATCGIVVAKDDVAALEREILAIYKTTPFSRQACLLRAKQFDEVERYKSIVAQYH